MAFPSHKQPKSTLLNALAVFAAAIMLLWPAWYNRAPLLFPDSIAYLGQGHGILAKVRGARVDQLWRYDSPRSELYASSLVFLHRGAFLFPIVLVQSVLLSWTVWLVWRITSERRRRLYFLLLTAALALLSEVAWFNSFVMPDIWGPIAYLALFLLVFVSESLRGWEWWALTAIALWGTTAHTSHLLVACGLCALFCIMWASDWLQMRKHGRDLAVCLALIGIAVASQEAVHLRMYGSATLSGHAPPFLTARMVADGQARLYLQQHCDASAWTLCAHLDHLPRTDGDFLWDAKGLWQTAAPAEQERMRREQVSFARAVLRAYPASQIRQSMHNAAATFVSHGPVDFGPNPTLFSPAFLNFGAEGLGQRYPLTRQSRDEMPQRVSQSLQTPLLVASLLAIALLLPVAWRRHDVAMLGLAAVVLSSVAGNAIVTGVLSGPNGRYQGRVAWLLPLLAGVLLARWGTSGKPDSNSEVRLTESKALDHGVQVSSMGESPV